MIVNVTFGVDSASPWTRIDTLLVDASLVWWALTIQDTLRSASHEWVSKETWLAGANCSIASWLTVGIAATGWWLARIGRPLSDNRLDHFWYLDALAVGITIVILWTRTPGYVIYNIALSIQSTNIGTGVSATFTNASLIWSAVAVLSALRAAVGSAAQIARLACALWWARNVLALRVWSTRRRFASIFARLFWFNCEKIVICLWVFFC